MNKDRYNFQPVYYQLAESLRNDIASGKLVPDQQMPTEEDLRKIHDVSRNTVRSALKKLENEGFIYRIKGKGTFVSPNTKKILTIIVVLNMLPHGHSSIQGLLSGALVRAQEAGVQLQLITKEQLPATLETTKNNPSVQAGVIFFRAREYEEQVLLTEKMGIPFIVEGSSPAEYNSVNIDNKKAMEDVVDHLYELGHRKFGIIRGYAFNSPHLTERYEAIISRFAELGVEYNLSTTINTQIYNPYERIEEKISSGFLNLPERPTAMICFTDTLAAVFIRWCNRNGISVPGDVSVTGFDNAESCRFLDPQLTTVNQDYYEIGFQAAEKLLEMMNNYVNRKIQLRLKLDLRLRDSTGPVSG